MLALMIGLAVGIDYALFIVSRYRAELAEGRDREEAAGRAVGTAGSAVVFAGLTVIIALAGLAVVGIPILDQMGLAAAGHRRHRRPHRPHPAARRCSASRAAGPSAAGDAAAAPAARARRRAAEEPAGHLGTRWARSSSAARWSSCCSRWSASAPSPFPRRTCELGLPDDGTAAPDTTQRKAYDLLTEGFGPGFNGPLIVVVDATAQRPQGGRRPGRQRRINGLDDVVDGHPAAFNQAGDTALLTVIPERQADPRRPRTWSPTSATRAPSSRPTPAPTCWSPAPPR